MNDQQPLVTVCIPTYDRPEMLRQSLQSVLWQSYRNLEVIVSDNASSTDTDAVVALFGDDRVRIDRLEEDVGLHGNLTRCLHLGSGKYRVMLPDDDLMLPGNVERKVRFFEDHPQVGLVHSAFRFVGADSLPYGAVNDWTRNDKDVAQPGHHYIAQSIANGGITCVSSVMLRSALVADEVFAAEDGPYCDLALWLRVAQRSDVGFLTGPLSGYRMHAASASSGFKTVEEVRGKMVLTLQHADALRLAYGRFVEHADLDAVTRAEYAELLRSSDRRMRLAIRVHRHVPPIALRASKKVLGWGRGGKVYESLSLYSAYSPEPVSEPGRAAGTDRH